MAVDDDDIPKPPKQGASGKGSEKDTPSDGPLVERDPSRPQRNTVPPALAKIPPEILKQIPPDVRRTLITASVSGPVPMGPDRLLDRIPEEQAGAALAKILEVSKHEIDREAETRTKELASEDKRHGRNVALAVFGIAVVAAIILTCIVYDKEELAKILVPGLTGLIAGGIGGYGLGRTHGK